MLNQRINFFDMCLVGGPVLFVVMTAVGVAVAVVVVLLLLLLL